MLTQLFNDLMSWYIYYFGIYIDVMLRLRLTYNYKLYKYLYDNDRGS